MGATVSAPAPRGRRLARAVTGAPRATVALCLVATLAMASLVPSLAVESSESMWLPHGPRTDAYRAMTAAMGANEYVGVLAVPAGGNALEVTHLQALLGFEDRALSDSEVAGALRYPRDPDANVLSVAQLAARTGALLQSRQLTFAQLAGALTASVATVEDSRVERAVAQAVAFVSLVSYASANPEAGHALVDKIIAELEVIANAGEAAQFKAAAVDLMSVLAQFARWSNALSLAQSQDAAVVHLSALMDAAFHAAALDGSTAGKQESLRALDDVLLAARFGLAVGPPDWALATEFGGALERGFADAANHSAAGTYAGALATLIEAQRAADVPVSLGDGQATAGLSAMARDLSTVLGSAATARARVLAIELFAGVFETAVAMGSAGFDMSTPQGNVSYNALTAALEENATLFGSPSANLSTKAAAAADIQARLAGVIANNLALNESGVFTCQPCFARQMTMMQWLNASLLQFVEFLSQPSPPAVLDAGARMVSAEILSVINVSAPVPHRIDLNMSSALATSLHALGRGTNGEPVASSAAGFERAAAAVMTQFDFGAASTLPSSYDAMLHATASALERFAGLMGGGEPSSARSAFSRQAAASFELPALINGSLLGEDSARQMLVLSSRAAQDARSLGQDERSPALYARWCEVFRAAIAGGFAAPGGILNGTDPGFLEGLGAALAATHELMQDPALGPAPQRVLENQTLAGTAVVVQWVTQAPAAAARENRTESSLRLGRMGNAGIADALRVLLVPGARASALPPGLAVNDSRTAPFVLSLSAYRSSMEEELRTAYGVEARQLLPANIAVSASAVEAQSTMVLFLFDGALERQVLGAHQDALRQMAASQSTDQLKLEAFGYGLMWLDTQRAMDLTVVLFSLSMLAVMFVALSVAYRRLWDAALTVLLLLFTVIWVLGTASLLGIQVNPITLVVPVLLIGLAEDYAVHVTVGYRRRRAQGDPPRRAGRAAVMAVGGVLLIATIINGLSFLSFGGAQIELIKDFGTLMALGLTFAFLLSVTFIPAASVWIDRRSSARGGGRGQQSAEGSAQARPRWSDRAVQRLVWTSLNRPYSTVAFVALITAASFLSALELPTTFSYAEVTAGDLPVSATLEAVAAAMAGSIDRAYIFIEGPADQPAVFLAMAAATDEATGDPYVVHMGGAASVHWIGSLAQRAVAEAALEGRSTTDPVSGAFHVLDTDGDGRLTAADNLSQAGLAQLYGAMLGQRGLGAEQFVARSNAGFDRAAVAFDLRNAVAHADEIRAALDADARPLREGGAGAAVQRVTVTGPQLLNQEVMAAVQDSGWQSVLLTVVLSALLLAVFFAMSLRAPWLGVLCVVPTLVAVGWTLGLMAAAGLSLNMMTVMIATSTVGMGDLYAIHVAHSHFKGIRQGKRPDAAVTHMTKEAAVPLLEAAGTTALGFLVLVASPIPAVRAYGAIFAVSIVFAFLFSVTLMPLIVRALARPLPTGEGPRAARGEKREGGNGESGRQKADGERPRRPVAGRRDDVDRE